LKIIVLLFYVISNIFSKPNDVAKSNISKRWLTVPKYWVIFGSNLKNHLYFFP
jgi:hypothetical protein